MVASESELAVEEVLDEKVIEIGASSSPVAHVSSPIPMYGEKYDGPVCKRKGVIGVMGLRSKKSRGGNSLRKSKNAFFKISSSWKSSETVGKEMVRNAGVWGISVIWMWVSLWDMRLERWSTNLNVQRHDRQIDFGLWNGKMTCWASWKSLQRELENCWLFGNWLLWIELSGWWLVSYTTRLSRHFSDSPNRHVLIVKTINGRRSAAPCSHCMTEFQPTTRQTRCPVPGRLGIMPRFRPICDILETLNTHPLTPAPPNFLLRSEEMFERV